MHLRTRLSLTFVVVVSPVLLLFLANFYYYFSTSNRDYFLNIVKNRGVTMTHLMSRGESLDRSLLRWIDEGTYTSLSNRRVAIFDEQNQLLYDSGELDDKEIQEPPFIDHRTAVTTDYQSEGSFDQRWRTHGLRSITAQLQRATVQSSFVRH
ncbi:hypothetical protein [Siphonobacter sp. BAB-5405]|uniref:hypothetical protein n=1 Tax=Siphonobacter sp. BAB-5405 TaxID=1864825 RepID=UPI001304ED8E|nr:hypothetical protein [Siphonobacter sp. BAB-5405]